MSMDLCAFVKCVAQRHARSAQKCKAQTHRQQRRCDGHTSGVNCGTGLRRAAAATYRPAVGPEASPAGAREERTRVSQRRWHRSDTTTPSCLCDRRC